VGVSSSSITPSKHSKQICVEWAAWKKGQPDSGIRSADAVGHARWKDGTADDEIDAFLAGRDPEAVKAERASSPDISACPDCNGTGMYYPNGYDKGVAKCRHAKLQSTHRAKLAPPLARSATHFLDGAARIRLANANAANAEALPVFRTEEQIRREKEAEGKKAEANARLLASLYGKLPEFDPNDPENTELVSAMREAGLPVVQKRAGQQIHLVHDEKNGGWTVVSADKYTGSASSAPVTTSSGGQLSTTSSSQVASSDRAADRASREREAAANRASRESVARLVVASREKVAAVNQEMQRDRQRLRESAFRIQYPGYGKTLTHDDIVTKYNEFKQTRPNLTLEETVQAAIDQGYTVQP
jgi:hypothetical protein